MTMRELRAQTGATKSQIENWTRRGWMPMAHYEHTGPGFRRTYSRVDVVAVRLALDAMREYGPDAARHVLMRFCARRRHLVKLV